MVLPYISQQMSQNKSVGTAIDALPFGMNACCTVLSTLKNNAKQEK
jgi:hypothetical protein